MSHTEGLGDLIALRWSLARNRVNGRCQAVGQKDAAYLAGFTSRGILQTCPEETVSTKGLLHRVLVFLFVLVWEMLLLFRTCADSMQVLYPGDSLTNFQGPEW